VIGAAALDPTSGALRQAMAMPPMVMASDSATRGVDASLLGALAW
jgi:hypothetical protein